MASSDGRLLEDPLRFGGSQGEKWTWTLERCSARKPGGEPKKALARWAPALPPPLWGLQVKKDWPTSSFQSPVQEHQTVTGRHDCRLGADGDVRKTLKCGLIYKSELIFTSVVFGFFFLRDQTNIQQLRRTGLARTGAPSVS